MVEAELNKCLDRTDCGLVKVFRTSRKDLGNNSTLFFFALGVITPAGGSVTHLPIKYQPSYNRSRENSNLNQISSDCECPVNVKSISSNENNDFGPRQSDSPEEEELRLTLNSLSAELHKLDDIHWICPLMQSSEEVRGGAWATVRTFVVVVFSACI